MELKETYILVTPNVETNPVLEAKFQISRHLFNHKVLIANTVDNVLLLLGLYRVFNKLAAKM